MPDLAEKKAPLAQLSPMARKRLDLQRLTDALGGVAPASRGSGDTERPLTPEDRTRLRQAIALAQAEFQKTLAALRRVTWITMGLVMVAIALAIAGGALLQVTPYSSLISIASVGALIPLLQRAWRLARDQSMLELVPARYALAAEFCQTDADARGLIAQFLKETAGGD